LFQSIRARTLPGRFSIFYDGILVSDGGMSALAIVRIAGVLGFVGVGLGAFGAHGLRDVLERHGRVGTWETAVLYHLLHAVALLGVAYLRPVARWTTWLFCGGILIFSGTLYLLALTNLKWLGAITPVGGVLFLAGWACLIARSNRFPDVSSEG
jgi:uncharacterized membrane protein YgdD (TMEM256/DUF423 family)